ncbi:MAG: hypothetical protein V4702_03770 [Patescibacteria group bacterium]
MRKGPEPLIIIDDPGRDSDGEHAALTAVGMENFGEFVMKAYVANDTAAPRRAKLMSSLFEVIGRHNLPVLVGEDPDPSDFQPYEFETTYRQSTKPLLSATEHLPKIIEKEEDDSVVLALTSSHTDAKILFENHPDLCAQKINRVTMMGGIKTAWGQPELKDGLLQPDSSFNYTCNREAARYTFNFLQTAGIPITFVSRYAVYGMPHFGGSPSPVWVDTKWSILETLRARDLNSAQSYWEVVHEPPSSPRRARLAPERDRAHFVHTRLRGNDPGIGPKDDIRPFINEVIGWRNLYDSYAMYFSKRRNIEDHARPHYYNYGDHNGHNQPPLQTVIGLSKDNPGVSMYDEEGYLLRAPVGAWIHGHILNAVTQTSRYAA